MAQPEHTATQSPLSASHSSLSPQVGVPARQALTVLLHVSTPLQAIPSSQLRAAPVQTPAAQTSSKVQNFPSSQLTPSFALNAMCDASGSQNEQGFPGSTSPLA
jgi:hypothetical protein